MFLCLCDVVVFISGCVHGLVHGLYPVVGEVYEWIILACLFSLSMYRVWRRFRASTLRCKCARMSQRGQNRSRINFMGLCVGFIHGFFL